MNDYRYPDPDLGKNFVALVIAFCLMVAFVMSCQKYAGDSGGGNNGNRQSMHGSEDG